jgi:hypothetical protein
MRMPSLSETGVDLHYGSEFLAENAAVDPVRFRTALLRGRAWHSPSYKSIGVASHSASTVATRSNRVGMSASFTMIASK